LAKELNVNLEQRECKYKGKCSSTCPQCQMEEELLNKALISAGICVGVGVTAALFVGATFLGNSLESKFNEVSGNFPINEYDV
jgi:hypothetical protein